MVRTLASGEVGLIVVAASARDATLTIRLPRPHTGQQIVRQQMQRHNFLVAGRRWRKTTLAMSVMVEEALGASAEYIWAAPTDKQVRRGWEEMKRACVPLVQFNDGRLEAHYPNGSVVYFLNLTDYDNKRGFTSFGTVIDEASEVAAEAYTTVLRPMLSDTNGWLLAFGTPKGQNWFFSEIQSVLHGDRPHAMTWQAPTLGARIEDGQLIRAPHPLENPEFSWDALLTEFQTLPERVFRQEYLAEFLDDAGGVFRNVDGCVLAGESLRERPGHRSEQYVIGIDLAKHKDFTVLCIGDLRTQRVVAFDRFNKADWGLQKQRIMAAAQKWNNALCWMDTTGLGDPIYDDLRHAGLRIHPYQFTPASKQALINNAVLMVEQQSVRFPPIPVLLSELKAYQYVRTDAGRLTTSAPEGLHDDAVVAFALMCWPMGHVPTGRLTTEVLDMQRRPLTDIRGTTLLGKTF